ncbi:MULTISPECIES: non-heme iron oxygenase ferredoxin subunit [Ignatzschineria]|uniref:Non-heme iron oxygenase ferredoxin subunit n=1 Tax=Ignatzschineria cameli TaxID=2182793 RepID=A0A2U2ATU4_9GAMM|nr:MULTISPECIES: non-heme iron oxygenase ferredoxin subunit [Ignatzschineria]OYQ78062.1 (2Fe-2S)-binding protein [Ignatzschineria sp. F8392]PWD87363.1 non-heme iron oxygenase ferredoxin subunit [Ignatzschineria cameli]PWD88144.1 non-heme iron oxygenase ferredoxin subunit [Ignatzschineria cameli]PWD91174.1 non-heme iron oxygenase ferredoxin subunit [Ignatzschineria cameli]PWD92815.1 non-heme iron oxygenase ferredoxin subunit [Ignatzschineria cameli]
MSKVLLCSADELTPGSLKKVQNEVVGDLCVYNLDGEYYATLDMCTHATASLAEGFIEDDLITCPVHWGQFNIKTGEAVAFPCEKHLRTFKIVVENGEVFADLESPSPEAVEANIES